MKKSKISKWTLQENKFDFLQRQLESIQFYEGQIRKNYVDFSRRLERLEKLTLNPLPILDDTISEKLII